MSTSEEDLDAERRLARRLPRAFPAFFGKFGRLRAVQNRAIPLILDGRSTLICSATASGKTEAACAPLVERYMGRRKDWMVLYISPTRALVNDLYERICQPLASLGLSVSRRTSDFRDPDEHPHFLLTTPESFDSLLCRGLDSDGHHRLSGTVAVVLDEVHLLYGSARGEQVRWLLHRLRRLREYAKQQRHTSTTGVQVVALSATVPSPEAVRDFYLPGGEIVITPGGRSIDDLRTTTGFGPAEDILPTYLAALEKPSKVLVFCNSRKEVDRLSTVLKERLQRLSYHVYGHHGSLLKPAREMAEKAMKEKRAVALVATSTLEIGIDIGDIDLVVLSQPPHDIAAFLQRIGRGNRRTGKTTILTCGKSARDKLLHDALLSAARSASLGPNEPKSNSAVAIQQLGSFIFQSPQLRRNRTNVIEMASACMPEQDAIALVDHLVVSDELIHSGTSLRLSGSLREATSSGAIHSNIEGSVGYTVVDDDTGVAIAQGIRYKRGRKMELAGDRLTVKRVTERTIEAKRQAHSTGELAQWSYISQRRLADASLMYAVREYLRVPEFKWPSIPHGDKQIVFHFGGGATASLLSLLAQNAVTAIPVTINEWFMAFATPVIDLPQWILNASPALVTASVSSNYEALEKGLARPKANGMLPVALRVREIIAMLDIDSQIPRLKNCTIEHSNPDLAAQLTLLLVK